MNKKKMKNQKVPIQEQNDTDITCHTNTRKVPTNESSDLLYDRSSCCSLYKHRQSAVTNTKEICSWNKTFETTNT